MGAYEVRFKKLINHCAAIAAPGAYQGGSFTNDAVGTTIIPGAGGGDTVDVFFNQNGGNSSNTDFTVMVAC